MGGEPKRAESSEGLLGFIRRAGGSIAPGHTTVHVRIHAAPGVVQHRGPAASTWFLFRTLSIISSLVDTLTQVRTI